MIFFILLAISIAFCIPGFILFYRFRKLESLRCRQWQILFFGNIILVCSGVMLTVSLELFEVNKDAWRLSCVAISAINICLTTPWVGASILLRAFTIQFQFFWNQAKANDHNKSEFYYRHRNFASTKKIFVYLVIIGTLISLPIFIVLGTPESSPGATFEDCLNPFIFINLFQMIPIMLFFFFLLYKFSHFRDPFAMKLELAIEGIIMTTTMIGYAVILFAQVLRPFYHGYNPIWFFVGFCYFYPPFSLWFPLCFTLYDQRRFRLFQDATSIAESSIVDVLKNPHLLEGFSKVVAEHWCSEALLFLIEISRINSLPPLEFLGAAKDIASQFILPDSRFQINIDQEEAAEILRKINVGEFDYFIFENAVKDVSLQLEGILLRWKSTPEFTKLNMKSGSSRFSRDVELRPLQPLN